MRGSSTLAALAVTALLAACASLEAPTPTSGPAPTGTSAPAGIPGAPRAGAAGAARSAEFDWPAARERLAQALAGAPDVVATTREDGALHLLVPGADAFARDRADLAPALATTLDRIASALTQAPGTRVQVFGHTDSMGRELYNLQLSIRRAEAVSEFLRSRGVALARLTADGRGEAEPIADNATEAGRARNRRVEIIVLPPE